MKKYYFLLAITLLLIFLPPAHSQAVANIAYTGSSYGYTCLSDVNGTVACLTEVQNLTIAFGNYTLTAHLYGPGYVFNHWITQGNLTVTDIQANNTLLEVNGDGTLAVVFLPTSQNQTAQISFSGVRGYVCFLNYANASGPVCLADGQNVTLPTGSYIAEASPYNQSDTFVQWSTQGLISVDNQTAYITNLTVNGNGVLSLVCAPTEPAPEFPFPIAPLILGICLIGPLLLIRKRRPEDPNS